MLLNGTPDQKKKLIREYLTGESESSSGDEFEKEMEAELSSTMKTMEGTWGPTAAGNAKSIRCIQMYKNNTHMVCIRNSGTQIFVDVGFCMRSFYFWLKQVQPWQSVGLLVWLIKTTLKLNILVLYRCSLQF